MQRNSVDTVENTVPHATTASTLYALGVESANKCFGSCVDGETPFLPIADRRRGGGPKPRTIAERIARFWARVDRAQEGCWNWLGGCTPDGYGLVNLGRRPDGRQVNDYAHRVMYRLVVGPIPSGLVIRHTCDNPPCCNPAHLILGTQADNIADAQRQGKYARPRPGGWTIPAHVRELAICATRRGALAELARQYGYSVVALCQIRRRAQGRANG